MKLSAYIAALLLTGCASYTAHFAYQSPNGLVVEHPGSECPDRSARFGCTQKVDGIWHVYYPDGYVNVRQHERDHTQGLTHGEWECSAVKCCAKVLSAGLTKWKAGENLCNRRTWNDPLLVDAPDYQDRVN